MANWLVCPSGYQIGMQGPQLFAKPRHFCKLDVATSRMAFFNLLHLALQIETIEGTLLYKTAPLTPPNVQNINCATKNEHEKYM